MPLVEATQGYISDVLANLPDEAMSTMTPASRTLANPYDPSLGYLDDPITENLPAALDPWEDSEDVDLAAASRLDITTLRARSKQR